MKKYLIGAAAALAIAAPGIAAAQTTGNVGVNVGNLDIDGSDDIDIYGLNAGVAHDFGSWTVQGDATSERLDVGGGDLGIGNVTVSAGVRNDSHAVYGFFGHSTFGSDSLNFGIGGQYHLNQMTFNGSVGYADFDGADMTAVNVDGTYFFTDNFGAMAEVGYGELDGFGPDSDWTTFGVGGVYRFTASPVALNFGYRRTEGVSFDADLLRLGVSLPFGTDTAREDARSGATFNGGRRLYEGFLNVL
jgi:hypothetical protein